MKQVTKAEFYAVLMAEKRSVLGRIVNSFDHSGKGYKTEHYFQNGGAIFGISWSGNCHGSGEGEEFYLNSGQS